MASQLFASGSSSSKAAAAATDDAPGGDRPLPSADSVAWDDVGGLANAKRALRESILKKERELFQQQQSAMESAVRQSEVGRTTITDTQLEAIIANSGKKR